MRKYAGFTLVEVLFSFAVVGVLTCFAVPELHSYRERSNDSLARRQLRAAAIAEELHFLEHKRYLTCADALSCDQGLEALDKISPEVNLRIEATGSGFIGTASALNGTGAVYTWDSRNAGMQ